MAPARPAPLDQKLQLADRHPGFGKLVLDFHIFANKPIKRKGKKNIVVIKLLCVSEVFVYFHTCVS